MTAKLKQLLFLVIAIGFAVFFIYITAKKIDFQHVQSVLKQTNYFWILLSMAISIFTYWIRAKRWNLLLNPIGLYPKTASNFWSIAFSYFMNLTIPRSGEVARATSLYKTAQVPIDKTFGTIVLERVIDLVCLLLVIGLCFVLNYDLLLRFFSLGNLEKGSQPATSSNFSYVYLGLGVFVLLAILSALFWKKIVKNKVFKKVKLFLLGIVEGLNSILKLKRRSEFVGWSVLLWICYFLMTYVVFFAFPDTSNLGLKEGLFLLVAGSFGMILPVTGGLGYPYIMSIAFAAMYSLNNGQEALGRKIGDYFGLILYLAQIISMIGFGLLAMIYIARQSKSSRPA